MSSRGRAGALVAANPAAGGVTGQLVNAVVAECRRWWHPVRVSHLNATLSAADVAAAAAADGTAAVVVGIGGDGTARDLAASLAVALAAHHDAPALFIVPAGTANSCYRTWWGDRPWPQALAEAAMSGVVSGPTRTVRLDLARLTETGALVLAGACAGFPAQAIHEARQLPLRGRVRYEAALTSLIDRYVAYPGRVLVDGVVVHEGETLLANVGGCRYRGGQFQLLAHSLLDDGLLDVCVIGAEHHPADVLRSTRTAAHLNAAGVVYARGRQVRIERTDGDPMWFEHDGEVLLDWANAATLQVVPAAVPVIVGPSALPASSWLGPIGATSGSARPR